MDIKRTATITVMEPVQVDVEGTFTVKKVVADWEAHAGQERWVVTLKNSCWTIDHFATEAEAVAAVWSGKLDEYLEDE